MTRFSEMTYERPDLDAVKREAAALVERLRSASDYTQARAVFLEKEALFLEFETMATLCSVRNSLDTRDPFYDAEMNFFNAAMPELQEYTVAWSNAMLDSPYRADFSAEYGDLIFRNAEIHRRAFCMENIPDMQKDNDLTMEYEKLLASAQVPFEGKTYTIPQMTIFKQDPDDERRASAWRAEGQWYKDHQEDLDRIYDELVHLRDQMGKRLGHPNFIPLGYDNMTRNCYGQKDVERFREAVVKYLVPVADKIYRMQAKRLGKEYPMSFADNALSFRSGNPRPKGEASDILKAGMKFYTELSPETEVFFRTMLDYDLIDVLSREGKANGGYCTSLGKYEVPFIFANFNGTQGDVEVVTHEAGHAFACWTNRSRVPTETIWPSMESCEVHSMSMEFFAWPWAEDFFGDDARKFRFSHLAGALEFIPYGTMVDHFQHIVYEHPEYSPKQRHAAWKELLGIYMPWMKLDGDIPFYSEGEGWQRQHHIYSSPFYYIDYCLAQTVSLMFWAMIQKDPKDAWKKYMAYTRLGGSLPFTGLLAQAGLASPFDSDTLRDVCQAAEAWLDRYDLSGIE